MEPIYKTLRDTLAQGQYKFTSLVFCIEVVLFSKIQDITEIVVDIFFWRTQAVHALVAREYRVILLIFCPYLGGPNINCYI